MMQSQELWNEVLSMFDNSNKKIHICRGEETIGKEEIQNINININSVLGVVVLYTTGICIDNWIRIIGQKSNDRIGISQYNLDERDIFTEGMLIVAQDIVGGIFAINISRFTEGERQIWFFAPDTLEWECLNMNYAEFIAWVAQGETDEFYSGMRWNTWEKDCKNISFDEVYLIYPFLWANECNLNTAKKKVVPYAELKGINFEHAKRICTEL